MRPHLVGDIGGTNVRLALVNPGDTSPYSVEIFACTDFDSLASAISAFLEKAGTESLANGSIAVATPVTGDQLNMTNNNWSFSRKDIQQRFALGRLEVINDFAALALSIPYLSSDDLAQVGGGTPRQGFPAAVIGAGTGLGVSGLFFSESGKPMAIEGEGGHVSLAPRNLREFNLVDYVKGKFGHVSAERFLSGPGLCLIHEAILAVDGKQPKPLKSAEISQAAMECTDGDCEEALDIFCSQLGSCAADLALTLGAYGGVYIGGGIVPRLEPYFTQSSFRTTFEAKGRMHDYLARISTQVILEKYPALIGAATLLV